ncbi:MAG: metallophosphoesterase family protein [Oscillospiraceae bacterium]|jgi:hypothetical protein|nr:metallophosphoesterase family protein [Oscillospiraceae bacterium]
MKTRTINLSRLAVTIIIILAFALGAYPALAVTSPSRVLLSWTGDPATTITITYVDADGTTEGFVRYSTDSALADATEVRATAVPNKSAMDNDGARFTATLTNLTPATTYWYSVGNGDTWSAAQSFTTAETSPDNFSFAFFGDIQVTQSAATDFAAWGKLAEAAYAKNPGIAFALQAGDIVESGITTEHWAAFLDNASPVFSKIPFLPTNGNHESNFLSGKPELYLDTFTLPTNGPRGFEEEFYSVDYGSAHILVVNSWVFSGEQRLTAAQLDALDAWVAFDLASSDAKFKIVLTHVPLYPVHSDNTGVSAREHWIDTFQKYGVTLMLVGHQHVYSRLSPLTNGAPDYEDGITQIMGNSGLKFYDSADETYAERTIYNVSNYQVLTVDGDELIVQTFDIDGNELDYVALTPRASESVTRAEYVDMLWRSVGSPVVEGVERFTDVPQNSPYAAAIAWARSAGIVVGVGGNRFNPNSKILPKHMNLILDRYNAVMA